MRVPLSWLHAYCDPGLSAEQLAERLSMTGTEVERIDHVGVADPAGFVVGRVLAAEQHPNADRLRVCEVDTGDGEPRTIVCGAPNVAAGQTVPVALPGAVMPDGTKLGKAKLRGIESAGMILSESELELGPGHDGIIVLEDGETAPEPGAPLAGVLPIAEPVLELEITPNRPDCLGVWGVAREVHAVTGALLEEDPWTGDPAGDAAGEGDVHDIASVRVEVPELCPRFTARAFTGVRVGPSPLWLKARLTAAGQRPINNVVDITNYVMLVTGQPLHSFDLDRVPGGELIVRAARPGERATTLDGAERELDPGVVVVADREGPSAIAGIMGGQSSEVSEGTTRVLLEAASWNGTNILRSSNRLALRSEASTRFEKQLHPELTMRAQALAARLLIELCGARLVPGTIDVDAHAYELAEVELRPARMSALLGMDVPVERARAYLSRLGFGIHEQGDEGAGAERLVVQVPADRHFDITREVDLIEEVARVHGLDQHLPRTLPARSAAGRLDRRQALLRRLEDLLRDAGLDEAITWSFTHPDRDGVPGLAETAPVRVHNPLSEDGAAMRTDLLGGLLAAAAHNLARDAGRVALFESGRVYLPEPAPSSGSPLGGRFAGERPAPVAEPHRIAALIAGPLRGTSWRGGGEPAGFYDAKGLLELVCEALGAPLALAPARRPFLHPARAADVSVGGQEAGWIGELHPHVLAQLGAPAAVAFELDAEPLLAAATVGSESYEDVTSQPTLLEDIAVIAGREVPAERIRELVLEAGGRLLRAARIFDVYEGEQVPDGKRSLALRLEFRAPDRTLTDAEVAKRRTAIVAALEEIGGSLRG